MARQLERGSGANAWLLLGPRGSGKLAAATAIAAALNCPMRPDVGCGECSSCLRTLRRRHPDVHHIVPEGPLIPVDVIREQVVPEAARSPFEGRVKVFIVHEAERMNPAAQNALLKTLEEPQPDTIFVLVSDNEEEVLETLRSRCRIVRLEPLSQERVEQALLREGATPESARALASAASGDLEAARALAFDGSVRRRRSVWASIPSRLKSPVDALDVASEVLDEARRAVKEREDIHKQEVTELAEALGEGRGTAAARNALVKRHRRELKRLEEEVLGEALAFLATFYRDVVATRAGGRTGVVNVDLVDRLEAWARSRVTDRALIACAERCVAARASFVSNANPTLAIEAALVAVAGLAVPPEVAA
jgi:DNA polymerase-3 subunit delta'